VTAVLDHTEHAFESLIVKEMTTAGGWLQGDPKAYDATLALYPEDVLGFIAETQPKAWEKLVALNGNIEANARAAVLKRLAAELDKHSSVHVLRRGFKERGVALRLCQFKPANDLDDRIAAAYNANRLRVVRQVRFDPKGGDSLDLVLFVNGVPTATAELKNVWTGQNVHNAIAQYRQDRDPKLTLFARRAFVHFAVDSELAYMSTRLAGDKTMFLPFNQGTGGPGQPGGAGNPGEPAGHPTSYLWRSVWDSDRWLELIEKFVHVELSDDPTRHGTIIFPRFHQWDVVLACSTHARLHGPGHSYLIQHSAGSGKTKEIAWLAHELSRLHDAANTKVFHKVVVITDRRVLDQQLQRQIAQFEQVKGVVETIDKDSAQLREALTIGAARIIVTTLQKFPIVLQQLNERGERLSEQRYAVIVDEAHSSQTGESAVDLKAVLGSKTIEDLDLEPEQLDGVPTALLAQMAARGHQPNLSFFAFTATPKGKTLELFGRPGPDGKPTAFHTYSMRQAIEEGYILDVLASYTTYEQLFHLETEAGELEVPKGRAQSKIAKYAKFHPYAKAQKAAVIVEHYAQHVRPLLGGQGKAMVVTSSREEAVRYKQAIDRVIEERHVAGVKCLVAFSGEVTIKDPEAADRGESYSEPGMNLGLDGHHVAETKLPAEFDQPAYGVLVVAEKYQTGFDQPKLCGMYVDKVLTDVNAVQTLSRLNRTHPGKDITFVLDFVNDAEQIRKAFEPYYGRTEATPTDPNVLFDAADKVLEFGIIDDADITAFAAAYFKPGGRDDHAQLSTTTQSAYEAAKEMDKEGRDALKDALNRFIRFYAFLGQVISYVPPETEQLYLFCKVLMGRLASEAPEGGLSVAVELTHYRLQEVGTTSLTLGEEDVGPLTAIRGDGEGGGGRGQGQLPMGVLAEVVESFNERYGADLTEADVVKPLEHILDRVIATEGLRDEAQHNERDDFKRGKDNLLIDATLDVQDISGKLLQALLSDEELRQRAFDGILDAAYEQLRSPAP
jgi:type I restriction enzyme R subunit